jgi:hypothetical protein
MIFYFFSLSGVPYSKYGHINEVSVIYIYTKI